MDEFLQRRRHWVLALLATVVIVLVAALIGLVGEGPIADWMGMIGIVVASLTGFLLAVTIIITVGIVCAFLIARITSFLFS